MAVRSLGSLGQGSSLANSVDSMSLRAHLLSG